MYKESLFIEVADELHNGLIQDSEFFLYNLNLRPTSTQSRCAALRPSLPRSSWRSHSLYSTLVPCQCFLRTSTPYAITGKPKIFPSVKDSARLGDIKALYEAHQSSSVQIAPPDIFPTLPADVAEVSTINAIDRRHDTVFLTTSSSATSLYFLTSPYTHSHTYLDSPHQRTSVLYRKRHGQSDIEATVPWQYNLRNAVQTSQPASQVRSAIEEILVVFLLLGQCNGFILGARGLWSYASGWSYPSLQVNFPERRPAQALELLKHTFYQLEWLLYCAFHLGTGGVDHICPKIDVLWAPTYPRFVGWTARLEATCARCAWCFWLGRPQLRSSWWKVGPASLPPAGYRGNCFGSKDVFLDMNSRPSALLSIIPKVSRLSETRGTCLENGASRMVEDRSGDPKYVLYSSITLAVRRRVR